MRCFHIPAKQFSGNHVRISGRELHHLFNVLRLRKGDEITVLDGNGGVYEVVLTSCSGDLAVGEVKVRRQLQPSPVAITLCVGLSKADKMDMIVQKATELGASRIIPVLCDYTISKPLIDHARHRMDRWRQIVIEASKQSYQPFFPSISDVLKLQEAVDTCQGDLKLVFIARDFETAVSEKLKAVLRQNASAKNISIFIGPEGGFSEDEIRFALSAGALPVSLGSSILRTETAAIAALAIVLYEANLEARL